MPVSQVFSAVSLPEKTEVSLKVAVAANFKPILEQLVKDFKRKYSYQVSLSFASSGTFYNQISHGAPYDVFLSADRKRPEMLEQEQKTIEGSRLTYAYGELALWHKDVNRLTLDDLIHQNGHIAIANPDTAPYGVAAVETLKHNHLLEKLKNKLVRGTSIQQTWQFVDSGNASAGFVALSQVIGHVDPTSYRIIPNNNYSPIQQDMVILRSSQHIKAAREFSRFLLSEHSQQYIEAHGYSGAL
ncbi:Molybdate-binding periplasmic protein [invertebrate metagenome]|uniref:Molybdate-binding periplasmic protein n=1 Tax=invertebrate metagenome TaxID=1711999 RepID=A0A2H9TCH9_9ZZZZ